MERVGGRGDPIGTSHQKIEERNRLGPSKSMESQPLNESIAVISAVFAAPPVPFNPSLKTLKGWAMFCLRDRGFIVTPGMATPGKRSVDFIVDSRRGQVQCCVSEEAEGLDPGVTWIVVDPGYQKATVIPPQD
jgi:hypothetical protein